MNLLASARTSCAVYLPLLGLVLACSAQAPGPPAEAVTAALCDPMPYLTGVGLTDLNKNPVTSLSPNTDYYIHACGHVSSMCLTLSSGASITNPGQNSPCHDTVPAPGGDLKTTYFAVTTTASASSIAGSLTPYDACDGAQPQLDMNFVVPGSDDCGATPPTSTPVQPTPTGLDLWLRADAGVVSAGGKVSRWQDQSGNANDGTMATTARQPAMVADALNDRPVVRFAGAQSLGLTRPVQPNSFTIFVVGKNSNPTESFSMILGPGGNWPNNQVRWENGSAALIVGTGNALPARTIGIGDTRVYHALSFRYDGSTLGTYRDGNAVSTSTLTTSGPFTLAQVGAWYSTYFMKGDLAEVLVYHVALSETDRATANTYLRDKYRLP